MSSDDFAIIDKHLKVKEYWDIRFGTAWRIKCLYGEVDYVKEPGGFRNPIGGGELVKRILLAMQELHPGYKVALNGNPLFMEMATTHAEQLGGVEVEPEVYDESEAPFYSGMLGCGGLVVAFILGATFPLGLGIAVVVYCFFHGPILEKLRREGREEGMKYRKDLMPREEAPPEKFFRPDQKKEEEEEDQKFDKP